MDWRTTARRTILDGRRARDGAWGRDPSGSPRVEPTALALLALTRDDDSPAARSIAVQACDWMAGLQNPRGGLPLSAGLEESSWPTSFAILSWNVLDIHPEARVLARGWLLDSGSDEPSSAGEDPGGWPWVQGTFTWIEPTALALIALALEGEERHPRCLEAVAMIHERALNGGGWNAGNKAVFGRELRPQPTSTALALIALAVRGERSIVTSRAVDYLSDALKTIRSAASLGWGLIALRAWDAYPTEADVWLAQAHELCQERDQSPASLALLLLAASEAGTRLFLPTNSKSPPHEPIRDRR